MALQDLLSALRAQAAERRAEVLARARAEAEQVRRDAGVARERRRKEYVARVREEEEAVAHRAVARARKEAVEGVLAARHHLLARVRAELEARLVRAADDAEYRGVFSDEVRLTLERLPDGPVRIAVPEALAGLVREVVGGQSRVTVETSDQVATGFIALADGDRTELDGTLQARLDHLWPVLAVRTLAEVAP